MVEPVAQTVWMTLIYLADGYIDIEAFVHLVCPFFRGKDDADCQNIVDFVERDMLVLHLVPDGIRALNTGFDLVFYAQLIEFFTDRGGKLCKEIVALGFCICKFMLYVGIFLRMVVFETEILQLRLDLIQSQAVSQWSIDIERFSGNLVLFICRLGSEGTHVVQTVADLDEDDTDIIAHGEQEFLEVFSLRRSLISKDTTADLGQSIYNLCYFSTEDIGDVFYCIVSIFHHVMEQGCTDTGRA